MNTNRAAAKSTAPARREIIVSVPPRPEDEGTEFDVCHWFAVTVKDGGGVDTCRKVARPGTRRGKRAA
jgi:hypothetical protein